MWFRLFIISSFRSGRFCLFFSGYLGVYFFWGMCVFVFVIGELVVVGGESESGLF